MPFRTFGPVELGVIAFIITMLFGSKGLPDVGSALGKGIRNFRRGVSGEDNEAALAANTESIPDSPREIAGRKNGTPQGE